MHEMIEEIFKDAGATEQDLKQIERTCLAVALETRQLVLEASNIGNMPERFKLPMRVLLCRVIHADMQKAFEQYQTQKPSVIIMPGK